MPPLTKVVLFFSYLVWFALMDAILYMAGNTISRAVLIVGSVGIACFLPYVFVEEIGWYLASERKLYSRAIALIKLAFHTCQLPGLSTVQCVSAAEIAQTYLWADDKENARLWEDKVGRILYANQKFEFQSMGRCGHILFALGDLNRAEKCLTSAVAQLDENKSKLARAERRWFERLANFFESERLELQAQNFDCLAKIALVHGNFAVAEKFFARTLKVLRTVWYCKTAQAYELNARASVLIAMSADADKTLSLLVEAANLIPERIDRPVDLRLAVDIVHNLEIIKTEEANLASTELLGRCENRLHQSEKNYLNLLVTS